MLALILRTTDDFRGRASLTRREGQGMAEYGLILAGVALLAIVAVFLLGPQIGALLNKINASLS